MRAHVSVVKELKILTHAILVDHDRWIEDVGQARPLIPEFVVGEGVNRKTRLFQDELRECCSEFPKD